MARYRSALKLLHPGTKGAALHGYTPPRKAHPFLYMEARRQDSKTFPLPNCKFTLCKYSRILLEMREVRVVW